MKKIISISVVFALIVGAVFAEVSVDGFVMAGYSLADGTTATYEDDSSYEVTTGGFHQGQFTASAENDDGTFGGLVRVNAQPVWYAPNAFAWGWWKPIDQFRIQLGKNPDGDFAVNHIVGWGWHANDAEDLVAYYGYENIARSEVFYGGYDGAGVVLTITPIEALTLNIGLPFGESDGYSPDGNLAQYAYKHLHAQALYDIEDIGYVAFTYAGGIGHVDADLNHRVNEGEEINDPSKLYLNFFLSAVENLEVNVGFAFTTPYTMEDKTEVLPPIAAGFGASYDMGDFGAKIRLGALFGGYEKVEDGDPDPMPFKLGVDIMPYYDLGILKFFFNAGIEFTAEDQDPDGEKQADSTFGWYVNPFITKTVGGGTFYAGVKFYSDGSKDWDDKTNINWGIPIGIEFSF